MNISNKVHKLMLISLLVVSSNLNAISKTDAMSHARVAAQAANIDDFRQALSDFRTAGKVQVGEIESIVSDAMLVAIDKPDFLRGLLEIVDQKHLVINNAILFESARRIVAHADEQIKAEALRIAQELKQVHLAQEAAEALRIAQENQSFMGRLLRRPVVVPGVECSVVVPVVEAVQQVSHSPVASTDDVQQESSVQGSAELPESRRASEISVDPVTVEDPITVDSGVTQTSRLANIGKVAGVTVGVAALIYGAHKGHQAGLDKKVAGVVAKGVRSAVIASTPLVKNAAGSMWNGLSKAGKFVGHNVAKAGSFVGRNASNGAYSVARVVVSHPKTSTVAISTLGSLTGAGLGFGAYKILHTDKSDESTTEVDEEASNVDAQQE